MRKLEIAAFNLGSVLVAQQNGASRVELCKDMDLGGTTPDADAVALAKEQFFVELYTMIRPRGGDFVYDESEFAQMLQSILAFKALGVDGFVFGILNADTTIDIERNKALIAAAAPLPCTFHRAFDECIDWRKALEDVISCGFTTILSSGGADKAQQGSKRLGTLVSLAGERISIMPGGGIRAGNLREIMDATRSRYYHSAAVTSGDTANGNEIQEMIAILEEE